METLREFLRRTDHRNDQLISQGQNLPQQWRRISPSFHQDERANSPHHTAAFQMVKVYLCLGSPIMSWPVREEMTLLLEHQ